MVIPCIKRQKPCIILRKLIPTLFLSLAESETRQSRAPSRFLKSDASKTPPPHFALVANKIDLEHARTVKSDRHHRFAQDNGLLTYAASAKSGEGVNLCFQKILAELLGIRLSKLDQEQQQQVVKAEIVTYRQDAVQPVRQSARPSAVCALQ